MLTAEQIDQYHQDGYLIPDFRLTSEQIEGIRRAHTGLVEQHPEFNDYCPALLAFDAWFLEIARDPEILDMVEQLIGPDFALWNSSFFAKPARTGSRTPWHQDGEYWPIRPLATCSVWIAIDDATVENGCLRFLPGSHRDRRLSPHRINDAEGLSLPLELAPDLIDESRAVDLVLKAGQISLHDIFLVHGSEPNSSAAQRRGMTLRYMPTSSVYRRDLVRGNDRAGRLSMKQRTLHLLRGRDISGANDFSARH